MTQQEKRLVIGVCALIAAALVSTATFNYIVLPMIMSLDASESQQSLLRQLPSIGALLMIFIAGVLGQRIGPRRLLVWCGLLMAVGYFVVMVSPAMGVTSAGMLLGSVGQEGIFVVSVGMLSAGLADPKARASGFAMLAMATPLVYLVAPVAAGALVGLTGWRVVIGMWVLAGLAAAFLAKRLLPPDEASDTRVELWTPALAGFALACLVQTANNISQAGWAATPTIVWGGAAILATVGLVVLMRRLPEPSLDISVLRHGGFRLLLVVILLVPFASMAFYATVGAQFVYGYGVFATSLIMIPVQVTSLAGAWLSGRMIRRSGIRATGTIALVLTSVALFLAATQRVSTPVVVSLLIVCLYSGALTAANAPMTNAIMNLAAKGSEGSAAAFRGASASLGNAIGVVIMSAIVFSTFQSSLTASIQASGGDVSQAESITTSLRDGVSSEQVASQYSVPMTEVVAADDDQQSAMVQAYQVQGIVGGAVVLVAALIFGLYRGPSAPKRSHRHRRRVTAEPK